MSQHIEPKDGFVLIGGQRLHYLECGEGPPLILLHSNGGSAYEYEEVFALLAPRFRVIAWDMPGQGDSDPLTRHWSVDDYADEVIALMDALGIQKSFVLGSSIGGAICVSLAARHAGRLLEALVTECPFRSVDEWNKMWLTTETNYSQTTQSRERVATRVRQVTDPLLARWNIDRNKAGPKTMLSVMWALRQYDTAMHLRAIKADVGLIFGDKGPTIGKLDKFVATLGGSSRAVVIHDAGHFPMLDDPAAFVNAILELTGTEAREGASSI